ncbi:MAG TPA: restriction endonuclease, partial [Longilinea sp.]|nr:restriction endonuclease [Longilinea sp.]
MDISPVKQAGTLFKNGDIRGARSVLQRAIQQNPTDANVWVAMAFCSDDVQQKFDYLQRALQINPSSQPARDALQKLMSRQTPAEPADEPQGETVQEVTQPQPKNTAIHGLPPSIDDLSLEDFKNLIGAIFTAYGMQVRQADNSEDHGIDLIVEDGAGSKCLVQCKRSKKNDQVEGSELQTLYGTMAVEEATEGAVFTAGAFTQQARG